jgi:hypothetical protein
MAVGGILTVPLAGARGQQVLQGPHTGRDPGAPLPCSAAPWPADGRGQPQHGAVLLLGLVNHDEGHRTLGRTRRPQPCLAPPGPCSLYRHGHSRGCCKAWPLTCRPSGRSKTYGVFPATRTVPWCAVATCLLSCEALPPRSATPLGGGRATPRRRHAATPPSSLPCTQGSVTRPGAPGPGAAGRRLAQSTGTPTCPAPMTPPRRPPARPASPRCAWPRPQGPTRPNCSPYVLHPASSPTQVQGQRRRVASLWLAAWCQSGTRPSTPQRRRRWRQERLGSAPRRREGRCLSPPRPRHRVGLVRPPHQGGHLIPTIFLNRFCCRRQRPSLALTRLGGRPRAWRAGSRPWAACCAWRRSRARRSCALRRRRWLAGAGCLASRGWGDLGYSWLYPASLWRLQPAQAPGL